MPMERFRISDVVPATPKRVYDAWVDGAAHAAMTGGGAATSEPKVGGRHTAWDGYITGEYLALEPGRRIVMYWRTSEFPEDAGDSRLEVLLEPHPDGTKVTFVHADVPEGQGERYEQGWIDHYLEPMKAYFGSR